MTRSLRLSRLSYACAVLALIGVSITFNMLQDRFGLGEYARSVRMGVSAAYIIFSSARLADAGFRYGLSMLALIAIFVVLPLAGFFAYAHYIGLPAIASEREEFLLIAAGLTTIVLGGLVTLFCLAFPSAAPRQSPVTEDVDILKWKPPGYVPRQERRKPRI